MLRDADLRARPARPDLAAAMRALAGASAAKVARIYRRLDFDAFDRVVVTRKSRNVLARARALPMARRGKLGGALEAPGGRESNVVKGEVIALDHEGVLARGAKGRLMVLLGVKDLVAVDTGDALRIASRKSSHISPPRSRRTRWPPPRTGGAPGGGPNRAFI